MSFLCSQRAAWLISLVALLAACGGGGSSPAASPGAGADEPVVPAAGGPVVPVPVASFSLGGTVSGLTAGLVLQNSGADDLTLNANGSFAFASAVAEGASYSVTVRTNPPFLNCVVGQGSGRMGSADTTDVAVTCTAGVRVSSLAGSTRGLLNGTGAAARFNSPVAGAFDADGHLLVADYSNNSLRKVTPAGVVSTLASGIASPTGVVVRQGRIYVVSNSAGKLYEVNAGSGALTEVLLDTTLLQPWGLVMDAAGNWYVSERGGSQRIRKISPAGAVSTLAGSGVQGSADGSGASASFNYPAGLAIDAAGHVYVADQTNRKIRKISPAGTVTTLAGSGMVGGVDGPGATARFAEPLGVAMGGDGSLYVADSGGQMVRRVAADGTVSTVAGRYAAAGQADGDPSVARFNYPGGLTFDAHGQLFLFDMENNRVRRLSAL